MDLLQRLRTFVAVAERGSFARAAESLSLARPRVTNAVATLEREMGVRLFHRTTRRTVLTGEGETLYEATFVHFLILPAAWGDRP